MDILNSREYGVFQTFYGQVMVPAWGACLMRGGRGVALAGTDQGRVVEIHNHPALPLLPSSSIIQALWGLRGHFK